LEEVAAELEQGGASAPVVVVADMADPDAPAAIRDHMIQAFGGVDILVNNAGGSQPAAIDEPEESWERGMRINFVNIRRLSEAVLPEMRQKGWGRIVNIGGTHEPIGINVTGSAKAALQFYAKALSTEVGRDGVTVNTIIPNGVLNQHLERMLTTPDEEAQFIERAHIDVGRVGRPADMGALVAFLVSPRAGYINGQVLYCDGGMHRYAY
jgi:3-oxoacyl-[acyl-carrier protein] reductase